MWRVFRHLQDLMNIFKMKTQRSWFYTSAGKTRFNMADEDYVKIYTSDMVAFSDTCFYVTFLLEAFKIPPT